MLFLRSRREFDGVWRFSYQSIGSKCGEPRTKGKLSPQSSSETGGEFSSPCLPSVSNHSLTESTSVWTKLARRSQHCTELSAFEIPQCCKKKKKQCLGGFQCTWHENVDVGYVWCQINNQTSEEMFFDCTFSCPCICTLFLCAVASSTCTSFITQKAFSGLCHHRLSGCTQEGLQSPVCSSSLQQLLTMEVVGISFFKRQTWFSVHEVCSSLFQYKMHKDACAHRAQDLATCTVQSNMSYRGSFVILRCLQLVSMAS